jgi:site-specific recombinase XerD
MGRGTSPFTVQWRGASRGWYVRFRHAGRRFHEPTGVKDERARKEAQREGGRIFAEEVSGRRKSRAAASSTPLEELVEEWLNELPTRKVTRECYEKYSVAHWLSRWRTPRDLSDRAMELYVRARLREVKGKTLRNELSALRQLLNWLLLNQHMREMPKVPVIKASVSGTADTVRHRTAAPDLTKEEVWAVIQLLPERSEHAGWPVKARAEFAYETGLRPETLHKLRAPENYAKGRSELTLTDDDDKELYGRLVPLSLAARSAIDRICPEAGLIFGRHRIERYVGPAAAEAAKRKLLPADKAAILAPQHLRSARATHWIDDGAPLTAVQYLLGHKHVSTTARYVRPSLQAARRLIRGG